MSGNLCAFSFFTAGHKKNLFPNDESRKLFKSAKRRLKNVASICQVYLKKIPRKKPTEEIYEGNRMVLKDLLKCPGRELNPHGVSHTPLKRTCLPVPPPGLYLEFIHYEYI
jgi:hypothetical protein